MKMKNTKANIIFNLFIFTFLTISVIGHPLINMAENMVRKDEKRYPNGTVVGKYTYSDNEGNPVHVKYFADDESYGVELKSLKILNANVSPLEMSTKYPSQISEQPIESSLEPFSRFKDLLNKNLTYDQKQLIKDKTKDSVRNTGEFEILSENEFKAPEKCGKEKVKVYFDKDKRKTRNVHENYNSMNYCSRF